MNTIELTIQRKTDSGYPVIAALTRPGGFLPLRRQGTLDLDIAALTELQYDPLAYGTALGQALFEDEIRDTFREGLAGGEPLRVLLSVEAPDLRALDWHRLAAPFDGRWRCLASQQNTPFSLSVSSPASAHFPALGRRDLRALLLVAGPESLSGNYKLASFDVAATTASIQAALGDIPCDVLPNPSLDALCAALTKTPYTFLHLVCHGAVNERGETILFFPKDSNGTPTPASDLLNRLGSLARLPHFAFISACESALPQNGLGSLAGRLVRELGLPAVLAMTDRVSIATAGAIAAPFYAHLYQHGQPDLALAQSLAGLQGAHDLTVPAIFSRLGDRPLFDDNSERALTDKELEFGLAKLAESLPERAPVMDGLRDALTRRLRSTLGADVQALSESRRTERKETLDQLNSLNLEALDLSFNALCLGQTPPAYDSRSPFRGLEAFRVEDKDYFFGREALTRKLVQKLNEHNFLAVLGASGSGKSSLVMAGLIPALNVPYAIFRPGAEPLSELEKALQAGPQLLVVDQFEELFTLSAREQRAEFISRLLEQSHRLRVVITLRADFLGEVAPFKSLKDEVQNHQEIIPPMDEVELRRAMEGQAGCAGLRFESDLSQQMLDDVAGEPGAMPLLQHALWTLWTRRHGRWLRAEEYRAFGGVKQAIASTADAVFARCNDFEKERLRDIFLRLTRLDESADGRDTRRRVLLRDLIPADSDPDATTLLIKQLADARLVVIAGDEVEVAHEALIRHWERLRGWLNEDRDNLRLREGVSDDARRWENANRDESLLNHRGPRLELALAMSKNPRYRLNPVEQAYLNGCIGLREMEKAAAAKRRRYAITGISAALTIIMAVLAGWGWTSSENSKELGYQVATASAAKATAVGEANARATAQANAEEQRDIALARQLSAQAQNILSVKNSKQLTAVLLAIQSMRKFPTHESAQILQSNTLIHPIAIMTKDTDITSISFSPDGRYVVSGGCAKLESGVCVQGIARVWDVTTGQVLANMPHDFYVYSVAFSSDSKYVVSGGGTTVCVWEAVSGKKSVCMSHDSYVDTVAFSPDGQHVLSGSEDHSARVWDVATGKETARMTHDGYISSVAFSPDGKLAISGGWDKTARVWETATGKEISRMTHGADVYFVIFSPDGKFVASGGCDEFARSTTACGQSNVKVWDALTGKEIISIKHDNAIYSVAFSADGRLLVSGCGDNTVRVWGIDTGNELARFVHDDQVESVAFSPDSKHVVSGSADGTARVWNIATKKEVIRVTHGNGVSAVAISADGKFVSSGGCDQGTSLSCTQGSAYVWKLEAQGEMPQSSHADRVRSVAVSSDGKYVVSGGCEKRNAYNDCAQGSVRIWDVANKAEIVQMVHNGDVESVAFSPDGKYVVSGSEDKTARVWEADTGNEIARVTHDGIVSSVAFSLNGKYVVSGGADGAIRVWNAFTGKEIVRMLHDTSVSSVAFSPNGKYVISGSLDNTARVWDAITGEEINRVTHNNMVNIVAFSPDGVYAASGSVDRYVKIWDAVTGKEIANFLHNDVVRSIAFSPNSKYLVSGSIDNTARVWDIKMGKEVARMTHDSYVQSVAFSSDSQYVVSGGCEYKIGNQPCLQGSARVWNISSGQEIARILHDSYVYSVAFDPYDQYIVSGGNDGIVRIWQWHPEDLIANACSRVTRNLTRAEWQQYIGDALPYQAVCPNLPIEPEPTATPTP